MRGRGTSVETMPRITRRKALEEAIYSYEKSVASQTQFIEKAYTQPGFKNDPDFARRAEEKVEEMWESLRVLREMGEERGYNKERGDFISSNTLYFACIDISRFYFEEDMPKQANLFLKRAEEEYIPFPEKEEFENWIKAFKEDPALLKNFQDELKRSEKEQADKGIESRFISMYALEDFLDEHHYDKVQELGNFRAAQLLDYLKNQA